jgi:LPPG:FO 2-phospho-L-lactate transferase
MIHNPKVVVLCGGSGGAKLANGLAQVLPPANLLIVANTADDFEHLGLYICPDLDAIMYTLAGQRNWELGWGRAGETWTTMEALTALGGPTWFQLGNQDLAVHLLRTDWLRQGRSLRWITAELCRRFDLCPILTPMSDDPVRTLVHTDQGQLTFQEYFVYHYGRPVVRRLEYQGAEQATLNPDIAPAIAAADLIILAPSNPLLSLDPILALPEMAALMADALAPKIAVSSIVHTRAIKGPAAKMLAEVGIEVSPVGVADHYRQILNGFVCDTLDHDQQPRIEALGLPALVTNTVMKPDPTGQARLATEVVAFGLSLA